MKEDILAILKDHRSNVIEMIKEENDDSLTQEIEAMQDAMITEVTEKLLTTFNPNQ
tara:strand:- start:633 stop:800 length:168 start_codon:yes stop_codon:yes gene_type:complete